MDRKRLLALLRAEGYQGDTSAKSIVRWLEGENKQVMGVDGWPMSKGDITEALARTR